MSREPPNTVDHFRSRNTAHVPAVGGAVVDCSFVITGDRVGIHIPRETCRLAGIEICEEEELPAKAATGLGAGFAVVSSLIHKQIVHIGQSTGVERVGAHEWTVTSRKPKVVVKVNVDGTHGGAASVVVEVLGHTVATRTITIKDAVHKHGRGHVNKDGRNALATHILEFKRTSAIVACFQVAVVLENLENGLAFKR